MSTDTELQVVEVERIDGTEVLVEFSDGTCARYTPQELADMKPEREKAV